ncbi:MAG TPA: ABC transporter permease [Micromonosporaceae bacterium]|nr:ABC transporter permease [Micromonosporaceae bacterium]
MSDIVSGAALRGAPATAAPPTPPGTDRPEFTTKERSQGELILRRFLRHRAAVVSLFVFLLTLAFAFLGPYVWKYDHTYKKGPGSVPPNLSYPFGTDQVGHDMLAQVIRGTQQSMKIALVVMVIATVLGTLWGAAAGFYRGWLDAALMRFVDILLTLPFIAVAIALNANIRGGGAWWALALVLGLLSWTGISRVVRGVVLSLREQEFIEAARAMGASDSRIILRHLVPNAMGVVIVSATIIIAAAILAETALSFIGFGVQAPDTSLGLLITNAQSAVTTRPWLFYFPGVFIILIALTINFIGDGLRDAFDPRQSLVRK